MTERQVTLFEGLEEGMTRQFSILTGVEVSGGSLDSPLRVARQRYLECLQQKKMKHPPVRLIESADEYAQFIIYLGAAAYSSGDIQLANACYILNRRLNSIDCYFTRRIPDYFHLVHPLGLILGDAEYANYFVCYQGVTVGGDTKLRYPEFGSGVVLYANATLIGGCTIGRNVAVGAGSFLFGERIASNSVLTRRAGGNQETGFARRTFASDFFHLPETW